MFHVIIADDAFPLSYRVLKPYSARNLSYESKIFNYRLSRARRMIESIFEILENRFRVLLNPINLSAEKVEVITLACIVLHNYLAALNGKQYASLSADVNLETLVSVRRQGSNNYSKEAQAIRNEFAEFFNTNGAVSWQQNAVVHNNL